MRTENPRRDALTGTIGCLTAVLGALAGIAVWFPYGRRGLFGGFEGETNPAVLWLGLPVMAVGGAVAALAVFALVRGRWRPALGLVAAVAGITAFGYGFDVLAGTRTLEDCGSPC
ncbi:MULTISPECIES: hypothetical protein [Streptomyces]|uniref:Uncharacterized protein n=1 Tax=Streptomyces globisporus C-1027 TaxID=1172567 RepID=A0A0U3KG63_STRGL|nr:MULTISPECIES: hypothetical protein [Streptomyces]ALU95166.1 hypothetical protein WQO_18680 [Streptomyces globisporus C-1027]OKJ26377.1 hypothetical protein AMK23_20520 [Streptomyces sp. CB02130]